MEINITEKLKIDEVWAADAVKVADFQHFLLLLPYFSMAVFLQIKCQVLIVWLPVFPPFPQCFKSSISGLLKLRIVWSTGNNSCF